MLATWFVASVLSPWAAPLARNEEPAAADPGESLLVRAQRVILRPGVELEEAAILVQKGVIVAVGEGVVAPEGAREIEGEVVCAGLIDSWGTLGVLPGSVEDQRTSAATATVDAVERWETRHWREEALRGGVTAARVQAGLRAPVGGIGAVIHADPGLEDGAVLLEDACLAGTIGVSRDGRTMDVFDRVEEVDKLVSLVEKGDKYRRSHLEYRAELAEWEKAIAERTEELEKDFKKAKKKRDKEKEEAEEKGKKFKEEKYKEDRRPREPRFDEDSEALARVANGELPLVVEVHRAEEIRNLLKKLEPLDRVRLVLLGATEAEPFADELARRSIPVVLWPSPLGAGKDDEYDAHDLALAGKLASAGVEVLIGSGGSFNPRDLRLLAALAVGHGLEREAAFAAITTGPASVFDLGSRVGSIERGNDADLVVLDGDPLDSATRVLHVVSRGRVWPE